MAVSQFCHWVKIHSGSPNDDQPLPSKEIQHTSLRVGLKQGAENGCSPMQQTIAAFFLLQEGANHPIPLPPSPSTGNSGKWDRLWDSTRGRVKGKRKQPPFPPVIKEKERGKQQHMEYSCSCSWLRSHLSSSLPPAPHVSVPCSIKAANKVIIFFLPTDMKLENTLEN